MDRKKAGDFDPEVLSFFDKYVHGVIDRRGFLDARQVRGRRRHRGDAARSARPKFARRSRSPRTTGGSGRARGVRVAARLGQDARLPGAAGERRRGKLPGVLVVHENRGLNPHIEDIARRLALDNFIAFAPDALAPLGGYPGDEDKARELFAQARPGQDARGLRRRRRRI